MEAAIVEDLGHAVGADDAAARLEQVYAKDPTDANRMALAQAYVARLEELLGIPVVMISTGPRREETIVRDVPPLAGWGLSI